MIGSSIHILSFTKIVIIREFTIYTNKKGRTELIQPV